MSEEQAIRFFPKYNRYQDEYFAKAQELQTQMQALRQMEERKAPDNEIDKQIEKIFGYAHRNEQSVVQIQKRFPRSAFIATNGRTCAL